MKYLCLVYLDEKKLDAVPDRECQACGDALRQSGHHIAAEALQPVHTATTVRVRNGKMTVTDGPFTETKELISGYWLIQVKSREEAMAWAKRVPAPHGADREGEIEIRQLFEVNDFPPSAAVEQARKLESQLPRARK